MKQVDELAVVAPLGVRVAGFSVGIPDLQQARPVASASASAEMSADPNPEPLRHPSCEPADRHPIYLRVHLKGQVSSATERAVEHGSETWLGDSGPPLCAVAPI